MASAKSSANSRAIKPKEGAAVGLSFKTTMSIATLSPRTVSVVLRSHQVSFQMRTATKAASVSHVIANGDQACVCVCGGGDREGNEAF